MRQDLINGEAFFRIDIENASQQAFERLAEMRRDAKFALLDLAVQDGYVLIFEWQKAAGHCKQNDA